MTQRFILHEILFDIMYICICTANMHNVINRGCFQTIIQRLWTNPAVALLGARQVGKSTLAAMLIKYFPGAIYLDLERPSDLNKLSDPEAFFLSSMIVSSV